jgi:hypothetical protein
MDLRSLLAAHDQEYAAHSIERHAYQWKSAGNLKRRKPDELAKKTS